MTVFKRYPKIHRLGKEENDGILFGECHVEEKIDGEGSKYLHIFTAPPALTIRVSDHPTGAEGTKNVKDKNHLVAESLKAYLKLK